MLALLSRFALAIVSFGLLSAQTAPVKNGAPASSGPALAKACEDKEGWSDPAPPAHVFGNVYMVGTCGIVSLLVTTPRGHFLIDGATAEAAPHIAANIEALGFKLNDVRYLLPGHEHIDHVGGFAELQRRTGAKLVARAEAKTPLETGTADASDPQAAHLPKFEGLPVAQLIGDGQSIKLGKQVITAIATPGHTPGSTSWRWRSCEGKICRNIVYADSLNPVSAAAYRFSDHPDYVAIFRASIAKVAAIGNCDIVVSPHPAQSDFFERLAGTEPLVDPHGCATYSANALARLEARLAKEAGN